MTLDFENVEYYVSQQLSFNLATGNIIIGDRLFQ